MNSARGLLAALATGLLLGSPAAGQEGPLPDPSKAEVPLETTAADWKASLVIDQGEVGIWTVKSFQVLPQYACPEVVGCDDQGRLLIMVGYSGKWTPKVWIHDGKWLGGLAHGEVDPRVPGAELYTGGQKGNLYLVSGSPHGALDARRLGWIPGHEIHTLVIDPFTAKPVGSGEAAGAVLIFTSPGALYRATPDGPHGAFRIEKLRDLPGRVRDALVLEDAGDGAPAIATVSRAGRLDLIRSRGGVLQWSTIHATPMGMGRVCRRPGPPGQALVLYSTLDDGRILRHEQRGEDWRTEAIYLGPQGPRGVAAGRFHADPEVETLAVFGYSARVQLLSRRPGESWEVETLFVDRDKGHWLGTAELDGRNATDELLCSGYGGRIVLLARPPGYGLDERVPTDPDGPVDPSSGDEEAGGDED